MATYLRNLQLTITYPEQRNKKLSAVQLFQAHFKKFDQEYLLYALEKLGNNFFGVVNIPIDLLRDKLDKIADSNITSVRFNLKRGGSASIESLETLSNLLFEEYGWHTELYVDSKDLAELRPILKKIPQFSIDHLGLSKEGLPELYYWAEKGIKIKATGFDRINFLPVSVMKQIYDINSKSLMFRNRPTVHKGRNPLLNK